MKKKIYFVLCLMLTGTTTFSQTESFCVSLQKLLNAKKGEFKIAKGEAVDMNAAGGGWYISKVILEGFEDGKYYKDPYMKNSAPNVSYIYTSEPGANIKKDWEAVIEQIETCLGNKYGKSDVFEDDFKEEYIMFYKLGEPIKDNEFIKARRFAAIQLTMYTEKNTGMDQLFIVIE